MSEHTKGLLKFEGSGIWSLLRAETNGVIVAVRHRLPGAVHEANIRRLGACWNSFDGVSTENIEANIPVKELADKYNAALRQRDQLLEALHVARFELRRLLDSKGVAPRVIREWPEIVQVDSAIAAAERGES